VNSKASQNPFVSVIILSYNRCEELRHTLSKVYLMDYNPYEVIVVDNNSTDGTNKMLANEFPDIKSIVLKNNIGVAGWNEGATVAKGDYLFFLDDDSFPKHDTLGKLLTIYDKKTILALDIRHPDNSYYSLYFQKCPYPTFIGCGVIIPRVIFDKLSGFDPLLFLYAHEEEFSLRAIHYGYNIKYVPNAIVYHTSAKINRLFSKDGLIDKRRQYFQNRNIIYLLFMHFPLHSILFRVYRLIFGRIIFSIFKNCFSQVISGIYDGFVLSARKWSKRSILNRDAQKIFSYGKYYASFYGDGYFAFKRPKWL
jgi:GT2 family glycosyltransferase